MKSPVGSHKGLIRTEIVEGLSIYQCPETGGIWIPARAYWGWLQSQPERLPHLPASGESVEQAEDDLVVKLCPESGMIMFPYRVGHGFNFRIDRSPTGGIWLDGGEWEQLKDRNFHDELHRVFTAPWQKRERVAQQKAVIEQRFKEKLGSDLYAKLVALHDELQGHPHRSEAIAFLSHKADIM